MDDETPKDINGNPVCSAKWYWAKNKLGQTVGVGMFLGTPWTFFINGTRFKPGTFVAYEHAVVPTFQPHTPTPPEREP